MPLEAVMGTLAVYAVLVVLLLSLNIFSLWRWWVKGLAILVTGACLVVAYFTITGLLGWPSFTPLPKRFSVVATRTIEPSIVTGAGGHVYMWVEELNENNVPVGSPRSFEVPYTVQLAADAADAQSKINSGKRVMGESHGGPDEATGEQAEASGEGGHQGGQSTGNTKDGGLPGGQSTAAETIGEGAAVIFTDMPPVVLPDKSDIADGTPQQ